MKNAIKHFLLIRRHRHLVFKLCFKAGIPFRGLVHDLSKYSPTEFIESSKHYSKTHSAIVDSRKEKGYSEAWLHHKGRNKHHYEYWYDAENKVQAIIPYKYAVEMMCDRVASSMTYKGKDFDKKNPYKYLKNVTEEYKFMINEKIYQFMEKVSDDLKENGIDYVFNKKYFQKVYSEIVEKK